LSELFGKAAGEPLQTEMSAVRILFELFGFLLKPSLVVRRWLRCVGERSVGFSLLFVEGSAEESSGFVSVVSP